MRNYSVIILALFVILHPWNLWAAPGIDADSTSTQKKSVAIWHAFDEKPKTYSLQMLKEIKRDGFSHIQLSPVQESVPGKNWYFKYQPKSYKIGNAYGNKDDITAFILKAKSQGLQVVADVVFNHMGSISHPDHPERIITANEWESAYRDRTRTGEYARFLKHLESTYHSVFNQFPGVNCTQEPDGNIFTDWNSRGWIGGELPQLNLNNRCVILAQEKHLRALKELGFEAFRFDAIKHMNPSAFIRYKKIIGENYSYGEFIGKHPKDHASCNWGGQPVTDFILLKTLKDVFSMEGSLADLRVPKSADQEDAVVFAVNHDTFEAKKSDGKTGVNILFGDEKDADLATHYLLSRKSGTPLILAKDARKKGIKSALIFRQRMEEAQAGTEWVSPSEMVCDSCNSKTLLVMTRGNQGITIINKSAETLSRDWADLSSYKHMTPGCFLDVESKERYTLTISGDNKMRLISAGSKKFRVEPRHAVHLVKTSCRKVQKIYQKKRKRS